MSEYQVGFKGVILDADKDHIYCDGLEVMEAYFKGYCVWNIEVAKYYGIALLIGTFNNTDEYRIYIDNGINTMFAMARKPYDSYGEKAEYFIIKIQFKNGKAVIEDSLKVDYSFIKYGGTFHILKLNNDRYLFIPNSSYIPYDIKLYMTYNGETFKYIEVEDNKDFFRGDMIIDQLVNTKGNNQAYYNYSTNKLELIESDKFNFVTKWDVFDLPVDFIPSWSTAYGYIYVSLLDIKEISKISIPINLEINKGSRYKIYFDAVLEIGILYAPSIVKQTSRPHHAYGINTIGNNFLFHLSSLFYTVAFNDITCDYVMYEKINIIRCEVRDKDTEELLTSKFNQISFYVYEEDGTRNLYDLGTISSSNYKTNNVYGFFKYSVNNTLNSIYNTIYRYINSSFYVDYSNTLIDYSSWSYVVGISIYVPLVINPNINNGNMTVYDVFFTMDNNKFTRFKYLEREVKITDKINPSDIDIVIYCNEKVVFIDYELYGNYRDYINRLIIYVVNTYNLEVETIYIDDIYKYKIYSIPKDSCYYYGDNIIYFTNIKMSFNIETYEVIEEASVNRISKIISNIDDKNGYEIDISDGNKVEKYYLN